MKKYIGRKFTATIEGVNCSGRVSNEGSTFYLCQSKKDGAECKEKFGYDFSWCVGDSLTAEALDSWEITDFKIDMKSKAIKSPKPKPPVMVNDEYEARIFKGYVMVGCQKITNKAIRNLVKKLK